MLKRFVGGALVAGLLAAIGVGKATAAPVVFTIDSTKSLIALSGSMVSGDINAPSLTIALLSQSFAPNSTQNITNSLQTRYGGTITAQYSSSADTITFLGASAVANNGGSYRPNDFAASSTARSQANYGGRIDIPSLGGAELALRQLIASVTSGVIPMSGPNYNWTFASTAQGLGLTQGRIDYAGSGSIGGALGTGTFDLVGNTSLNQSTTAGSLVLVGPTTNATATLTVPIRIRFAQTILGGDTPVGTDDIFVDLLLAGQLVAVAVVPEASSLVMLGLVGSVVGYVGYRRRNKKTEVEA
ncbi:MAG: hypothetical protein U1D30_08775 [Planctomycetota bacterium]